MLEITVPKKEFWDPDKEIFVTIDGGALQLEHSLVSISKWESKWEKPFFNSGDKTTEETIDYIKCMVIGKVSNPDIFISISKDPKILEEIKTYINRPMSATWFNDKNNNSRGRETITSELIYYWMISFNIPFECQKWHINRLLTLIRICGIKNQPAKKMKSKDISKQYAELNAKRQAQRCSK